MALILNIETSTTNCSISLAKDGNVLASSEKNEGYSHAENLASMVEDLLSKHKLDRKELDAICVGKGPGSFTGLRIGVSFAKGLSFGLGIPLISIGSLEILLEQAMAEEPKYDLYVPTIDARRMEIYCAMFDAERRPIHGVQAKVVEEGSFQEFIGESSCLIFGDNATKLRGLVKDDVRLWDVFPSARSMCALGEQFFKDKIFEDTAYFEPYYLKDFRVGAPKSSCNEGPVDS